MMSPTGRDKSGSSLEGYLNSLNLLPAQEEKELSSAYFRVVLIFLLISLLRSA